MVFSKVILKTLQLSTPPEFSRRVKRGLTHVLVAWERGLGKFPNKLKIGAAGPSYIACKSVIGMPVTLLASLFTALNKEMAFEFSS